MAARSVDLSGAEGALTLVTEPLVRPHGIDFAVI